MADNIEKTWFVFRLSKILGPKILVSRSNQQGSNLPAKRSGTSVGIHWRMLWKQSALPRLRIAVLALIHRVFFDKDIMNYLQNNPFWPNHACSGLWFGRLFNSLLSRIGGKASWPMRNVETFPSKQMYLYLSVVKRKVAQFYHKGLSIYYVIRSHTLKLSFFLHWHNFWRVKFTPKNANFSR